jgi:hypothetical protein
MALERQADEYSHSDCHCEHDQRPVLDLIG